MYWHILSHTKLTATQQWFQAILSCCPNDWWHDSHIWSELGYLLLNRSFLQLDLYPLWLRDVRFPHEQLPESTSTCPPGSQGNSILIVQHLCEVLSIIRNFPTLIMPKQSTFSLSNLMHFAILTNLLKNHLKFLERSFKSFLSAFGASKFYW